MIKTINSIVSFHIRIGGVLYLFKGLTVRFDEAVSNERAMGRRYV